MGLYIEVPNKREWFDKEASPIAHARDWSAQDYRNGPALPVAFLDNWPFTALAVLFGKQEYNRVTNGRADAQLGLVSKEILRGVVAGGSKLKELK